MRKMRLSENMKLSSKNRFGVCSVQMIIILMSVVLISSFIIESTHITFKSISRKESAIQENLWGESIFQIIDVYLIQSLEEVYNTPPEILFTNSDESDKIKIKILRYSLFELWNTQVRKIGNKLSNSNILQNIEIKYKSIDKMAYVYDNSYGVNCFKINRDMITKNISSSEDFALTISVKVEKNGDRYVYSKDYFFKIPMYSDELINKEKNYYKDESNVKPWVNNFEFDTENTLVKSEVYYEKN